MLNILRAFAWIRWRVLINSLEKSGARDTVERFSLAIEHIGPIILALVMIPTALAFAGVAGYTGYHLASGAQTLVAFEFLRYLLLAATALTIVGPILVPAADRTNPVRLLLLPIPPRALYVAQAAGAVADPWALMVMPILVALAVGLLAGGAAVAAAIALVAGLLLMVALLGMSALTTTLLHLLLRDRRRGELIALGFIVILPLMSFLPSIIGGAERRERRVAGDRAPEVVRRMERATRVPTWIEDAGTRALAFVPSEAYANSMRRVRTDPGATLVPLAGLLAAAVGIHAIGLLLFQRVVANPGTTGAKRTASMRGVWERALPGASPATSAVALALARLTVRTPRGRAILLSPLLMLAFFGFLVYRSGSFDFGPFGKAGALGLATFAAFVALMSSMPISMNQFAVDGAGLTMTLLSPLSTRQLLAGKAIGGALISLPPALLCVALAALVFRSGDPAMWAALAVSLPAVYIATAPALALFSMLFPRVVDMNSIGRGSNAHGLSGIVGILGFAIAGVPCVALTLLATQVFGRPWLAPALILLWSMGLFVIARLVFPLIERTFERRRENLAMLM